MSHINYISAKKRKENTRKPHGLVKLDITQLSIGSWLLSSSQFQFSNGGRLKFLPGGEGYWGNNFLETVWVLSVQDLATWVHYEFHFLYFVLFVTVQFNLKNISSWTLTEKIKSAFHVWTCIPSSSYYDEISLPTWDWASPVTEPGLTGLQSKKRREKKSSQLKVLLLLSAVPSSPWNSNSALVRTWQAY